MKTILFSAGVLLIIAFVHPPAWAATWYVDAAVPLSGSGESWETAFKAIQAGIYAASSGDTVIVAWGTYHEKIHFDGKNLVVRSIDPLSSETVARTVIDGGGFGSVVAFDGTEDETCVIAGFTILNGTHGINGGTEELHSLATVRNNSVRNSSGGLYGGGVYCCDGLIEDNEIYGNAAYDGGGLSNCGGTIRGNIIRSNVAEYKGGGLFDCDGLIEGNTIDWNRFLDPSKGLGGGLIHCDGTIRGNTVSNNSAFWGGGISSCAGLIERNIVRNNSAVDTAGGIGACDGVIRSNLVYANSATLGAGVAFCGGPTLNNTIASNPASERGGGLEGCDGLIANCILWGNTAPTDPQISNSSEPTYSCIQGWSGGGEGNITTNPAFVNPSGAQRNYRVPSTSPCVDAGINSVLTPPGLDLDGYLRISVGVPPALEARVDMGAYEYGPRVFAVKEFGFVTIPLPGGRRFIWNSQPNDTYSLWIRSSLTGGGWSLAKTIASQGTTTSCTDTGLLPFGWRSRFYRIGME